MVRQRSLQEAKKKKNAGSPACRKKKAHVAVRPELAALLPLLLLNNSFQNGILHSERWQILTKASSLVHRFFSGLQSTNTDAGHGVNHQQMAAERRLNRHPQTRMALGDRGEPVGKIAQYVTAGCEKHRCHHDGANALRNQKVDGRRQIGTHELEEGQLQRQLWIESANALGERLHRVGPARISRTMTEKNQPLLLRIGGVHRIRPTQPSIASARANATRLGMLTDTQAGQVFRRPR